MVNQKSVRYSVSTSYFTNIAVQNVNIVNVYITDFTASLTYCYLQATIRRAIFFMFVYVSNVQVLTGKH